MDQIVQCLHSTISASLLVLLVYTSFIFYIYSVVELNYCKTSSFLTIPRSTSSIRLWVQRTEFESQFTRKFSRRKFRSSAIYCGCKANHLEPTTNCLAFKQPNRITDRTVMYCVWHSNRQSRTSYHAWSIEHEKVHHPRNARLRAAYTPLLLWQ